MLMILRLRNYVVNFYIKNDHVIRKMPIDISAPDIIVWHKYYCKSEMSLEKWSYNLGIGLENSGIHCGYQKCCIDEFISNFGKKSNIKKSLRNFIKRLGGKNTGYMPCIKCSLKIFIGKITLESLITKRKCKYKFPQECVNWQICTNK